MLLRARMEDLEKVKEADRDLTLQTKYHLPSSESPTPSHKVCLKGLYVNFTFFLSYLITLSLLLFARKGLQSTCIKLLLIQFNFVKECSRRRALAIWSGKKQSQSSC